MHTTTLDALPRSAHATVVGFRDGDDEAIRKLLALGLVPGDRLHVLARWPACLFEVGSARYAVDRELASRVIVTQETAAEPDRQTR